MVIRVNFKKLIKPIGILLLYIVLSSIESIIFYALKTGSMLKDNFILIILASFTFIVILLISRKKILEDISKFKGKEKQFIALALKYWLYGFVCMFVTNLIISVVFLKGIAPNEAANRELLQTYEYYSILSTCFLAPIMEEIIFRLNFKEAFNNKNKFIIFTGLLFAAMHLLSSSSWIELIYIIPYTCLGITFSKIYAETDNILSSVIIHIIHNTITLFIILGGI